MPPQDSDLILAGLYPEIIKMIVNASDADLESLANMRMISPAWNSQILENLSTQNTLMLHFGEWEFPPHLTRIDVGHPSEDRIIAHIQHCARLDKLELRNLRFILSEDLLPLQRYLRDTPIQTMELTRVYAFAQSSCKPLVDLVRQYSVQHLHMNIDVSIEENAIREFIDKAMQSAQSIKIRGRNKNAVSEQYFGLPRMFWETLTQELNVTGNVRARMLIVLFLLSIAAVVYYFGINRIMGLPPGPPPLPLLGNMLSFNWNLDKVLLDWKSRYGRVFTVWLPFPMVVIGDHELLQEHVVKNGDVYLAKRNPEQLMQLMSGGLYGLVFEDNDMVKEQRKFALKTLHEVGFGSASLEDTVHHYALETVDRWGKSDGAVVNVTENISKAIGNVVWRLTFGLSMDYDNAIVPRFRQLMQDVNPLMGGPLIMLLELFPSIKKLDFLFGNHIKKLKSLMDEGTEMVAEAIEKTKTTFNPDNQPSSYVEAFLREMNKNEEAGKANGNFHYQQMLMSASTLWGAGFETTVGLLRMCCLELVNHPAVQRKLQTEIDTVIGDRRIRNDDQKQLPYTCAFLQEIYRLGNVLPINFLRMTTQDTEVEGRRIPSGTTVLPQFSMVHSDPKEFERPDLFCPERHVDGEGQFIKDPRITPFSVGKRACLGETLARMEIFILFATFVQHCHFTPVGKVPPTVEFNYGFARSVKHFDVKIAPRN
ncbi:hypothetical protein PRIPAC_85853 [Pristionchus pacificus]|uniref:Cytochrome P450 n=1 Tax=Pristionchus pacificus TaxID=54126 RepID=A0A2A6BLK1_PRIPA|nr:hypothetical protein PRIPAC_85853 [Pristionchus pacificus]|eukprot:PDM66779.1 cytochrome P450 [Pristionchus pacificus]